MAGMLMAHCCAIPVTREALAGYNPPEGTKSWVPVKHSDLVDALHSELGGRGLRVAKESYAVQRDGRMFFGVLDLNYLDNGEYAAAIGVRQANDKSMAIQLAIGMRVFVCDNMAFSGDLIALNRRHTSRLDLPREIKEGIDRYQEGIRRLSDDIDVWKHTPVDDRKGKEYIYDIFRKKIVPVRLFHPVTNSWQKATAESEIGTAWTLHNCFTEHIKMLKPAVKFNATVKLGKFFTRM